MRGPVCLPPPSPLARTQKPVFLTKTFTHPLPQTGQFAPISFCEQKPMWEMGEVRWRFFEDIYLWLSEEYIYLSVNPFINLPLRNWKTFWPTFGAHVGYGSHFTSIETFRFSFLVRWLIGKCKANIQIK